MARILKTGDKMAVSRDDVEWVLRKLAARKMESLPAMLTLLMAAAEIYRGTVIEGTNLREGFVNYAGQAIDTADGDMVSIISEGEA